MSVELARTVLQRLIFEISTDFTWRARMFAANDFVRFPIVDEEVARYAPAASGCGLHFAVFLDGVTEHGHFVFGFECTEYPDLTRYSTNNPAVP